MFKIGIDPTIKNNNGNYASYYMEDIEQFKIIYKSHYPGILAAIDKQNVEEVRKFARGEYIFEIFFYKCLLLKFIYNVFYSFVSSLDKIRFQME